MTPLSTSSTYGNTVTSTFRMVPTMVATGMPPRKKSKVAAKHSKPIAATTTSFVQASEGFGLSAVGKQQRGRQVGVLAGARLPLLCSAYICGSPTLL